MELFEEAKKDYESSGVRREDMGTLEGRIKLTRPPLFAEHDRIV
jgi:hypothetical protein